MLGMSRSQFYAHVKRGVFPKPEVSPSTRRPYYTAQVQEAIVAARQTGIGCNGEYVVFYERSVLPRTAPDSVPTRNGIGDPSQRYVSDLVTRLGEVGLVVTGEQVRQAVTACFPSGTTGQDEAAVLRAVNRYLRRPSSAR
jgi:hypothetical protein